MMAVTTSVGLLHNFRIFYVLLTVPTRLIL